MKIRRTYFNSQIYMVQCQKTLNFWFKKFLRVSCCIDWPWFKRRARQGSHARKVSGLILDSDDLRILFSFSLQLTNECMALKKKMMMSSKHTPIAIFPFFSVVLFYSALTIVIKIVMSPCRVISTIYLFFIVCWIIIHEGVILVWESACSTRNPKTRGTAAPLGSIIKSRD